MARRALEIVPSTVSKNLDIPMLVKGLRSGSSGNSRNLTTDGSEINGTPTIEM